MTIRKPLALTLFAIVTAVAAAAVPVLSHAADASTAADHDGTFAKQHPRREQVNERLANQRKRTANELAQGDLTPAQAAKVRREDRHIRQEERLMASQNGGHITKLEQRTLNQQENKVSRQIGQ